MRGIVLIAVILGLTYWAASSVDLPDRSAEGAIAAQQELPWRRTSAGWVPLEHWMQQTYHQGWALDPVTLSVFQALLAVLVMVALSRHPKAPGKANR